MSDKFRNTKTSMRGPAPIMWSGSYNSPQGGSLPLQVVYPESDTQEEHRLARETGMPERKRRSTQARAARRMCVASVKQDIADFNARNDAKYGPRLGK